MSKKPNIVQLTNDYIDNANQEQRLERAEHEQRNRFMGGFSLWLSYSLSCQPTIWLRPI